jgi:tetratricopeptide (TPR) repeat protein
MSSFLSLALMAFFASPETAHRRAVQLLHDGEFHPAVLLAQTALPQYESRFGATSLETALMLRDLAKAYQGSGLLAKAESAERREIEILHERLGEEDANMALAQDALAEILIDQGRFMEAGRALRLALRIAERKLDARSPHLASILNDLGAIYYRDGHPADAARLFRQSLAIRETAVTRANLDVIESKLASRK